MSNEKSTRPRFEGEAFRPLPLRTRLFMTIGPLGVFGLVLGFTALWTSWAGALFVLGLAAGGFVGAGKLVILAGAIESAPVGVLPLAGIVVLSDVSTALIIIAHMQILYRFPALGRRIAAARAAGFRVLGTQKWVRRAAVFGVGLFVAFPFQGTGAVLGVMVGQILGLRRRTILLTILLGSSFGAAAVALVGRMGREEITAVASDPLVGVVAVGAALVLTILLGRWFLGQSRGGEA